MPDSPLVDRSVKVVEPDSSRSDWLSKLPPTATVPEARHRFLFAVAHLLASQGLAEREWHIGSNAPARVWWSNGVVSDGRGYIQLIADDKYDGLTVFVRVDPSVFADFSNGPDWHSDQTRENMLTRTMPLAKLPVVLDQLQGWLRH